VTMPTDGINDSYRGEIVIYQPPGGAASLDVRLSGETLWLTQAQIAELFQKERSVVTKHLRNIFSQGELERASVSAFFAHTAADGKTYQVEYFNLDAILSVGYRVNSRRGTQFRIWATGVLRSHLVSGYSANERRLVELRRSLRLVEHVLAGDAVSADEATALLRVVTDYAYALDLLDDYDHQRVAAQATHAGLAIGIAYDEARGIIVRLREKFGASSLFGLEKDGSLHSSLNAILQTFDGQDVYPSLEEKAAHLLHFLVKNHSFVDGNKRIAAALSLWFMEKNGMLHRDDGARRIANNALVAITLLIAVSEPAEKRVIISMVVNLINGRN
jgi:prophage maintenance system killer protein